MPASEFSDVPDVAQPFLTVERPGGGHLSRWVAGLAVDDAARRRAREHWLRRQAEEEGTFVGVLADLGERGRPVRLHTTAGRRLHGVPLLLGRDVVLLAEPSGREVLVRLTAIASVRTTADQAPTLGDHPVAVELGMAELIAGLAADRPRLRVVHLGGESVSGEARHCGRDVLALRLDGGAGTAYLAVTSLSEVSLAESG